MNKNIIFDNNIKPYNLMEKLDIFIWIKKVIETCSNDFHFLAVDKLIDLFNYKYKDDNLTKDLKEIRQEQWDEIHVI